MIIIQLTGGLGNQMFQYAFGLSVKNRLKIDVKYDLSSYDHNKLRTYVLDCFKLNIEFTSWLETNSHTIFLRRPFVYSPKIRNILMKLTKKYVLFESSLLYSPEIYNKIKSTNSNIFIIGQWGTERYFKDIENKVRKVFQFKQPLSEEALMYYKKIASAHNPISIHVRRGDYITNSITNSVHGTCSLDYYQQAIKTIIQKNRDVTFFVFSDDINWCKINLVTNANTIFIDYDRKGNDYQDMQLMSYCKHHIIANSTFSWWGAWLNPNLNKIVIAPRKWFNKTNIKYKDIYPKDWILI